jgi:hypothetical protein
MGRNILDEDVELLMEGHVTEWKRRNTLGQGSAGSSADISERVRTGQHVRNLKSTSVLKRATAHDLECILLTPHTLHIVIHMQSEPSDQGSPVTKSMEISCQGRSGIGRGRNIPKGAWRPVLER